MSLAEDTVLLYYIVAILPPTDVPLALPVAPEVDDTDCVLLWNILLNYWCTVEFGSYGLSIFGVTLNLNMGDWSGWSCGIPGVSIVISAQFSMLWSK